MLNVFKYSFILNLGINLQIVGVFVGSTIDTHIYVYVNLCFCFVYIVSFLLNHFYLIFCLIPQALLLTSSYFTSLLYAHSLVLFICKWMLFSMRKSLTIY